MILASTAFVVDPAWPWSLPHLGWPALVLAAGIVAGLTVLTYLVGQRPNVRQFVAVLALRLTAVLIVFLLMLRPSLAQREENVTPSKLLVLVDSSTSMNNRDEFGKSRWEAAWRLLQSTRVKQALKRLQDDQKVELVYYQAAEDIGPYEPEGKADGKRTDMGQWLHTLAERHGSDPNIRGVVILSDGADNGTTYPTLEKAARLGFPVHTIGLGSPKTAAGDKDIYFVPDSIVATPSPVPAKTKLTIKAVVNAPGLAGAYRPLSVLIDGKEVAKKQIQLKLEEGNKIEVEIDAPAQPGDCKVELKIAPLKDEVSEQNNDISTYVNVTKDGFSVLWVEGKKRLESTWVINQVLSQDPKVRVFYTVRLKEKDPAPEQEDWFDFANKHYDVIVVGDISGSRFCGNDPKVFTEIQKRVQAGTGLLVLGGYESFANSDWQKYPDFTAMLPVKLDQNGQVEGAASVTVKPTAAGLDHYIMKLDEDPKANATIWKDVFRPLDGMTKIGTVLPAAISLATDNGDATKPVMAFNFFGQGRVVVFGGDTTYKAWNQNEDAVAAYAKFWKRLMYWLAQKDKATDDVWVKLDTRRLPAGGHQKLGFSVGLNPDKSKKYGKVTYKVEIKGPNGKPASVPTWPKGDPEKYEHGGSFFDTNAPGEYTVEVRAFDEKGKEITTTPATARFLTYAQDLENLRPAADHGFLSRLAGAGGGQFRLANENDLADLLGQIGQKTALANQSQQIVWPDWNRDPLSPAAGDQVSSLISSGILLFYLLFCGLICTEWLLRRHWRMV